MGACSFGEQRKLVDEHLDFQAVAGISSGTFLSEDDFSSNVNVKHSDSEEKVCCIFLGKQVWCKCLTI